MIDQHATCQHRIYKLDCADFLTLLDRADGACEVCGAADRRLHIDHEHGGPVRGLLCAKCNALLSRVDRGIVEATPRVEAYRAGALVGIANRQTPAKTFRAPDDLWLPFRQIAETNGSTASAVLVAYIRSYIRRHQP